MDDDLKQSEASEKPTQFIRTFAGDAEALKKGTEPDLVPYGDAPVQTDTAKPDSLGAAIARIPMPGESSLPRDAAPQDELRAEMHREPATEQKQEAIDLPAVEPPELVSAPETPELNPESPPMTQPRPDSDASAVSPIETYSGDFSEHMRDADASAITVLAAQQDAPRQEARASGRTLANALYLGASVVLLLIGAAGAYGAYQYYARGHSPVVLAPTVSAPIFVDSHTEVSGTGLALQRAVAQSVASPPPAGSVRLLYSTNATSTDNNVFINMQLPAPGELLRNLSLSGSMAGVLTIAGRASPFFILPVTSYANTFAAMLDWEQTMPQDLATLFPPYPVTGTTTASVASTTAAAKGPVGTFIDKIIANHNTRVYQDAQGRTVLLYGYWDQSTLIIARNEAAFTEILNRLANSKSGS